MVTSRRWTSPSPGGPTWTKRRSSLPASGRSCRPCATGSLSPAAFACRSTLRLPRLRPNWSRRSRRADELPPQPAVQAAPAGPSGPAPSDRGRPGATAPSGEAQVSDSQVHGQLEARDARRVRLQGHARRAEGRAAHERVRRAQARAGLSAHERGRLRPRRAGVPARLRRARGAGPRVHASTASPSTTRATTTATATPTRTSSSRSSFARCACSRGPTRRSRGTSPSPAAPTTSSGSTAAGSRRSTRPAASARSACSLLWGPSDAPAGHVRGRRVLHDRRLRHEPPGEARDRRWGSTRSPSAQNGVLRVNATAYVTEYNTAGVVREDDYDVGPRRLLRHRGPQPSRATPRRRASHLRDLREPLPGHRRLAAALRHRPDDAAARELDGLPEDVQEPTQTPHVQRGDLIDFHFDELTLGGRGFARWHGEALGPAAGVRGRLLRARRPDDVDAVPRHGGQPGSLPHGRGPHVDARRRRRLRRRATCASPRGSALRGGVRADMFLFDVLNNCAVTRASASTTRRSQYPEVDSSCLSELEHGVYREPFQRSSTGDGAVMPRGTLVVGPVRALRVHARAWATASARWTRATSRKGCSRPSSASSREDLGVSYSDQVGRRRASRPSRSSSRRTSGQDLLFDPTRGAQHARQRLDAHGLVGLGARRSGASSTSRRTRRS